MMLNIIPSLLNIKIFLAIIPIELDLHEGIKLIVLDTQWFLHKWEKA